MPAPSFKVAAIEQGIPFRDRAVFADYHQFVDPGATAVLIALETASHLRGAAAREWPLETGGLLCGRVLRDSIGRYVIVSGFAQAAPSAGRSGMFVMSPQATAALRAEAARQQPTADVIGWWHSHGQPSEYSGTDRSTQGMWTQPDCVGLLVFASGAPWAHVYLGPEARRVTMLAPSGWKLREPVPATEYPAKHEVGRSWRSAGQPRLRRSRLSRRVRVLAAAVVIAAAAVFLLWLRDLGATIASDAGQLSRAQQVIAHSLILPSSPPSVSWRCVRQAARTYSCAADPALGTGGTVEWLLNGRPYSRQSHILVHLPEGSPATSLIRLQVRVPAATYDLGTQELAG